MKILFDLLFRKPDPKDNEWWAFGIREGDVIAHP